MIVIVEELREGFAEHKSRGARRTISTTRGPLHEILHTRLFRPRGLKNRAAEIFRSAGRARVHCPLASYRLVIEGTKGTKGRGAWHLHKVQGTPFGTFDETRLPNLAT